MAIAMGKQPTQKDLSRFPRALKLLGLEAFTHEPQEMGFDDTGEPMLDKSPRPTLLLNSRYEIWCLHPVGATFEVL